MPKKDDLALLAQSPRHGAKFAETWQAIQAAFTEIIDRAGQQAKEKVVEPSATVTPPVREEELQKQQQHHQPQPQPQPQPRNSHQSGQ